MKDDGDFIKELRNEIEATQSRRISYVKAKLTFIVSLLGIGNISFKNIETGFILFLPPFVAYVFDFFILGEDFGIRRAGTFIRNSPASPREEVKWEKTVSKNRDPFSKFSEFYSTLLVLVVSAIAQFNKHDNCIYYGWLSLNIIIIAIVFWYQHNLDDQLNEFEENLNKSD